MNRIQKIFQKKTEKLIPYITAGYPKLHSTKKIVFKKFFHTNNTILIV